ncbi:MAG: hypothetical protein JWO56_276, partial [Acidobacteria bacterium]|nr:hypothetical protein [Acidobacteriota bacterium]
MNYGATFNRNEHVARHELHA